MKQLILNETKEAYQDMIMDGILSSEPYVVSISKRRKIINTACWTFKKGKHIILVGEKILDKLPKKALGLDLSHYIQSYLYHEVAHSLYTEKDLRAIDKALKAESIPFRVHNLFEDLRIESQMRADLERKFLWTEYEELERREDPLSKLFILVQCEYNALIEEDKDEILEMFDIEEKITDYYHDTTECKDSWEVIDVIKRWIEDYPLPPKNDLNDILEALGMGEDSDLSLALELQESGEMIEETMDSFENINDDDEPSRGGPSKDYDPEESGEPLDEHSSFDFSAWDYGDREIYTKTLNKMLPKLKSIFVEKSRYAPSRKASKRLNIKGIVNDSDYTYKRKETESVARKSFNIMIDCSGSMHGAPMHNAATIVALFSSLAREGLVDGHVVLSSSSGYQTLKIPMSDEQIKLYLQTGGAEGFHNTFKCVEDILKKGDTNFCITDGHITDGPLDKKALTKKGIHTFGLYVGDPNECNLSPWFHRGIAREKLSELIDELVRNILVRPL